MSATPPWNRTKIVVTLGPSSSHPKIVSRLIDIGVDVFRLNFSHGSLNEHSYTVGNIRRIAKKKNVPLAIMGDLPGPKFRIGTLPEPLTLQKGNLITLTSQQSSKPLPPCRYVDKVQLEVPYPWLIKRLNKDNILYLRDGSIKLKVVSKIRNGLLCKIESGGHLTSRAGINIPGISHLLKTVDNRKNLEFISKHKLDMLAVSFVKSADDIVKVRRKINSKIFIIAKIETKKSLQNIDEIIKVSDGIMVARGDLGVELPLERVAIEQKEIIYRCNLSGKPVITATQMLESMLNSPRPTRAEVSDVSNAILDGTDAVMLSSETAIGKYPIEAVEFLTRIAEVVESRRKGDFSNLVESLYTTTPAISLAACTLARQLKAKAIITPTRTGATAKLVSKYRPNTMIIAPTITPLVQRQLMLFRGVYPILVGEIQPFRKLLGHILKKIKKTGLLNKGDLIVVTGGTPDSPLGTTNLVEVHRV